MKIGTKVKYYPVIGRANFEETIVKSEPWEVCGTMCCKLEGVRGGVDINHLEILNDQKA